MPVVAMSKKSCIVCCGLNDIPEISIVYPLDCLIPEESSRRKKGLIVSGRPTGIP
jgi:hypothetical protein